MKKTMLFIITLIISVFTINVNAANKVVMPGESDYNTFKLDYENGIQEYIIGGSGVVTLYGYSNCESDNCEYMYANTTSSFEEVLRQAVVCDGGEKYIAVQATGSADAYKTGNLAEYVGEVYWSEDFAVTCTNTESSNTLELESNKNIFDLSTGDVIIGYTKFTENTWISASRAARAGALYTKEAGDTFVRTFIYVDDDIWYEMSEETGSYYLLEGEDLENIKANLNIYYVNNEPIKITYDAVALNELYHDYLIEDYEVSNITHEDVSYDDENKTFTCPYGVAFVFDLTFRHPEVGNTTERIVGECGSEIKFTLYEMFSPNEMEIDYIQMAISELPINNQGKMVEAEYYKDENTEQHYYTFKTVGDLNAYQPYYGIGQKKWIGFRVNFGAYNVGYNYNVYSSGLDYYVNYGSDYMDIYIDVDSYNTKTYNYKIIIMDSKYNKQEYINITYLPYSEDLSIEYTPDGEIQYIANISRNHTDETSEYIFEPLNSRNRPIFYYNGRIYVNKHLEYGSSFLFTDDGVLKSLDSYTYNDDVIIRNISDVNFYTYAQYDSGYYTSGRAMTLESFDSLYNNVINDVHTFTPNATDIIEYFFENKEDIPTEKLSELEKTGKFIIKDTSDVFYKNK